MPLYTEIHRDGEAREINWGWWHVERMQEVAILEHLGIEDVKAAGELELNSDFWAQFRETPLATTGQYTATGSWHFRDELDGEEFSILAGDVLVMHR